jgi:hypothetical protein
MIIPLEYPPFEISMLSISPCTWEVLGRNNMWRDMTYPKRHKSNNEADQIIHLLKSIFCRLKCGGRGLNIHNETHQQPARENACKTRLEMTNSSSAWTLGYWNAQFDEKFSRHRENTRGEGNIPEISATKKQKEMPMMAIRRCERSMGGAIFT